MFNNDLLEVIKTYSGATKFHAFYVDSIDNTLYYLPKELNYEALINYFDFKEILVFTGNSFSQNLHYYSDVTTYHTFRTKNNFLYNIIFSSKYQAIKGAIISGPILINLPDERQIENILEYNRMPICNKPELKELIKNLPFATMEQIDNCGRILLALFKSDIKGWSSSHSEIHSKVNPDIESELNKMISSSIFDTEQYISYKHLYRFIVKLKEDIIQGNTAEVNELLEKSIDIFWSADPSKNILKALKIKCIITSTLSCIYSIQGKAPVEQMINMQYEFLERLEMLKTADEIVSYMMTIVKAYTHAVSKLTNNTYSMHVNRALQYIKNHYTEEITLKTLANYTRINHIYLSSLIKKETKLSLSENINMIRIEQSKDMLIYTNKSLNEIAHTVGYNYQNHFSVMFKKFMNITPFEFRKKYGQNQGTELY